MCQCKLSYLLKQSVPLLCYLGQAKLMLWPVELKDAKYVSVAKFVVVVIVVVLLLGCRGDKSPYWWAGFFFSWENSIWAGHFYFWKKGCTQLEYMSGLCQIGVYSQLESLLPKGILDIMVDSSWCNAKMVQEGTDGAVYNYIAVFFKVILGRKGWSNFIFF